MIPHGFILAPEPHVRVSLGGDRKCSEEGVDVGSHHVAEPRLALSWHCQDLIESVLGVRACV